MGGGACCPAQQAYQSRNARTYAGRFAFRWTLYRRAWGGVVGSRQRAVIDYESAVGICLLQATAIGGS